jgi:methyl-accepting chemotaxis protein
MKQDRNTPALTEKWVTGSFVTAGIVFILTAVSFVLQLSLTPSRNLTLAGGLIDAGLLILGLGFLVRGIWKLSRALRLLEKLVKPLAEKDFSSLLLLSGSKANSETPENYRSIEESLASLGRLFEAIKSGAARNAVMREALQAGGGEQEAVLVHLEEVIDTIVKQFFEIESSARQAFETLENMEGFMNTLSGNAGTQTASIAGAGSRLSASAELSAKAAEKIEESAVRAETLRHDINTGEEQTREVREIVKTIAKEVEGIAEMTDIINQISEQTNILSMNAAIESAHAGQAGAGFAVVAGEIKKLAESTKKNAGLIYDELKVIVQKTGEAMKASETSFETFNGASGEMNRLASDLKEISQNAGEAGEINSGLGSFIKESVVFNQRLKDGGADMMAYHQSFKASLEMIHRLSDKTRAEIKEIHSGTQEILENIRRSQDKFYKNLEQTGELKALLPGIFEGEAREPDTAAPAAAANTADGMTAPARKISKEDYSDSREVVVKNPPRTIL